MKVTPHINTNGNPVAETVLLPGDPLRAKFIAEKYLSNVKQFNSVRNALGFTGQYKGKQISVLGTGMGVPSMGIYSYELINFFGAKNLIRIGSCGAMQDSVKLYDVIIAMSASTNSNFGAQFRLPGVYSPTASWSLLEAVKTTADKIHIPVTIGNVLTADTFYDDDPEALNPWMKMGVLAVEMETAGLYMTAARHGANAVSILTVSDHILSKEVTTATQRENSFTNMMDIALETVVEYL